MFLNGDRNQREHQLADFIEGYEEFNDFDARQLSWIEALRTLRIMHHAATTEVVMLDTYSCL